MAESKWEKYKKKDKLDIASPDEALVLLVGVVIFNFLHVYRLTFIVLIILWYWLKIRFYERKIVEKNREIYNVYYDNIRPVPQEVIDKRTEHDRKPMLYDLEQLESKRKFLVDKFIVLNLILILLVELFIN